MYPPVSILLDLHRPGTLRRLYDSPTVITTEPRPLRLREFAGHLASPSLPALRSRRRRLHTVAGCDQLASRA